MLSFPNAKVNLGLHVIRKRKDGFHDIETVFYPISMHDSLEVMPSRGEEASLEQYGPALPPGDNIVWKAYQLLRDEFAIPPVEMHLLKGIPSGAGLGGGSSDAAHALMMLSDMFSLDLDKAGLEQRAASLGSDCAFFIRNEPVLATGRGEVMIPVEIDLSAYDIRIARPGVSVSTAEAYAMIKPRDGRPSPGKIIQNPLEQWKDLLFNDFEEVVFKRYPVIRDLRDMMYQEGAIYAAMSGSGSAVYGIFPGD